MPRTSPRVERRPGQLSPRRRHCEPPSSAAHEARICLSEPPWACRRAAWQSHHGEIATAPPAPLRFGLYRPPRAGTMGAGPRNDVLKEIATASPGPRNDALKEIATGLTGARNDVLDCASASPGLPHSQRMPPLRAEVPCQGCLCSPPSSGAWRLRRRSDGAAARERPLRHRRNSRGAAPSRAACSGDRHRGLRPPH